MEDDVTNDLVGAIARAMREEAGRFRDPVYRYVETEAEVRWREANPDRDPYDDCPDRDWATESWAILASAVFSAIEREGYTLVPPQRIEGVTFVCELPRELGAVTGMRVQDDRVICDTESGIPFVLSAAPKQG